jgi:hypothetical protein
MSYYLFYSRAEFLPKLRVEIHWSLLECAIPKKGVSGENLPGNWGNETFV